MKCVKNLINQIKIYMEKISIENILKRKKNSFSVFFNVLISFPLLFGVSMENYVNLEFFKEKIKLKK